MDTDVLIRELTRDSAPVRPLPAPSARTVLWLAISLGYVAMVVLIMRPRPDLVSMLGNPKFVVEQSAALATAITAAFAAFCASIPGHDRRHSAIPLITLGIWIASLGGDCLVTIAAGGWTELRLEEDWMCLPAIALAGAVPAALIVIMLRRGAPLAPALTLALGGLAAAGLGSFGLRLFHADDASLMVLVWQCGTVAVLAIGAGVLGPQIINWQRLIGNVQRADRIGDRKHAE